MNEPADKVLATMKSTETKAGASDAKKPDAGPTSNKPQFNLFEDNRNYGVVDLKTGKISTEMIEPFVKPRLSPSSLSRYEHSLPFKVGNLKSFRLPMGLTIISGATGVGKSTLLRSLPDVVRLLAVEPADDIDELQTIEMFDSVDHALMTAVVIASTTNRLVAIDSLRAPLFETNGPAGAKGVIMPFFTKLTRVSNSLAQNGLTVLATVNPMDDDPVYTEAFLSKISSAVPAFIRLSPGERVFNGTISTRSNRGGVSFLYDPTSVESAVSEEVEFTLPNNSAPLTRYTNLQLRTLEGSK
jgi:energy-coupling factor transporter ATP-binding protein EcfA2